MTFDDLLAPGRLWLLLVVLGLGVLYVVVLRWRRGATVRFTRTDLLDRVAPARPRWRRHVVAALQLLGLATAVVALARPVDNTTERTASDGKILMLFDVSLSMMADDVDPDRFAAAQEAAREFVDAVDDSVQVGLISFSGAVAVEQSPTLDHEAVDGAIDGLELAESTAIGDALAVGTDLLVAESADGSTTGDSTNGAEPEADAEPPGVMVLLSDGETTVGRLTSAGAEEAAAAGIPVYTIAFGTAEGTIVDPVSGQVVPVPVRPADLELVADSTGGEAFAASTGDELADAYDTIQDQLGETLGEEIEVTVELTWRWAMAAFLLLATAWGLSLWWLRGMV
jgi:Ca-activated chloride channel family protein